MSIDQSGEEEGDDTLIWVDVPKHLDGLLDQDIKKNEFGVYSISDQKDSDLNSSQLVRFRTVEKISPSSFFNETIDPKS